MFFQTGYKTVAVAGVPLAAESILNFVSGATAVDNPGLGRTDVTITASGGSAGVTWLLGTDAAYQPTAARGRQIIVIPTFTANHTWKFPAAPQDGDQIELYDRTGVMATSGFVLSMQGAAGTEHVFAEGADKGTLYAVPNALLGNGSVVFTYRNTSTTWEMA